MLIHYPWLTSPRSGHIWRAMGTQVGSAIRSKALPVLQLYAGAQLLRLIG